MIKNLLNADEDPPPGTKVIIEETIVSPPVQNNEPAAIEEAPAYPDAVREVSEDAESLKPELTEELSETPSAPLDEETESLTALASEIENLDDKD